MKKLSEDNISVIINRYSNGESSTSIARSFNVTTSTITSILKKSGISLRENKNKITEDQFSSILELHQKGISLAKIGATYGVSDVSILKIINKLKNKNVKFNIQSNEIPSNYGTTFIPSFEGHVLNKNYLNTLSEFQKERVANYLFQYYRSYGFPFPIFSDEKLNKDWEDLKKFNSNSILKNNKIISTSNSTGLDLFKHFYHNFYNCKEEAKNSKSMLECFNDDQTLINVIKNRIGLTYKETFNMTGNMLRQGFRSTRSSATTSIFKPVIAKFFYDNFCPENGTVYDYSMGFGHRLLGALSSNRNIKYIGCDPWEEQITSGNKMLKFLKLESRATLVNLGSEDYCPQELYGSIDLAFSSPPYYNKEVYIEDPSQAYASSYDNFINDWWNKVCKNIFNLLKKDGIMILNMFEQFKKFDILQDMTAVLEQNGFAKEDVYYLSLSRSHFTDKSKTGNKYKLEPVTIFRKKI